MRRPLPSLLLDDRAAAIIELALLAPVLVLTYAGIADISTAYSRKLALEQGAQRAIEKIMQTTEDSTVEGTLATEAVCQVNGTNSDGTCKSTPITTANVTVTYRLDCTNKSTYAITSTTTTNSADTLTWTCPTGTLMAQYISVVVTDKYTPTFPIHFTGYDSSDGTYHLSATAGMRTS
ncbi:TadE/TadG family type IV pilus assembly protein [Sphingomonas ginkgonis]|nr:TadE/TadG family type IV pilus assembly protein [Sphingomonas ginkgonis]